MVYLSSIFCHDVELHCSVAGFLETIIKEFIGTGSKYKTSFSSQCNNPFHKKKLVYMGLPPKKQ